MKKLINALATLFCLLIMTHPVMASASPCDGTEKYPCTVQDTDGNTPDIKHWRDAAMIAAQYQGNTTGLDHLWMSGSGAPSKEAFKSIVENIQKNTQGAVKKIIDVDLRQETHGYLNNNAITLAAKYDWINREKTDREALKAEHHWLKFLSRQEYISNVLTSKQFKSGDFSHGINVFVQSITSEKKIARHVGLNYVRLMVTDHMAPNDASVDQFVALVKHLPPHTWLHFHCRGGDGRTTTFMALYDMLNNANNVSFDEIIKRQASVPPYYDLSEVNRSDPSLTVYYQQRLTFLMQFYQFAIASLQGYSGSWSEWIHHRVGATGGRP